MGQVYMTERESYETDWLANSVHGYGFGYTKEQALMALARHTKVAEGDGPELVTFVEHVGNASVGPGSLRVDEFVSGERAEISEQNMIHLQEQAIEIQSLATEAIEEAETEEMSGEGV